MSDCQLEVLLDGPAGAPLTPGAPLSGTVVVRVDEPVRCDGLDVELCYVRRDHHGEGGSTAWRFDHAREGQMRLFDGSWPAGEHRYPFELPAPSTPSYDGQKASWGWEVRAHADVPWAVDPEARAAFVIAARPDGHEDIAYELGEPEVSGVEPLGQTLKRYAFPALTAPVLGFVIGFLPQIAAGVDPPNPLVAAACALAALALLIRSFVRARRRAGRQVTRLDARIVRPAGDYRASAREARAPWVDVVVTDPPGKVVDHVEVRLEVWEQTAKLDRTGSGPTSYWPIRAKLWAEERRLEPSDVYHAELPLPDPGTAPFSTGRDERGRGVYWQLEARVIRQGGDEDWVRREIRVTPA